MILAPAEGSRGLIMRAIGIGCTPDVGRWTSGAGGFTPGADGGILEV